MIYQFKQGAHIQGDAQKVGERLAALEAGGRLTPEVVLRDAANTASVLHSLFEWDDQKAGHKWRVSQAGHLIRCVTIVIEPHEAEEAKVIRAFVAISGEDDSRSYVQTMTAMADADMRKQVLTQAYSELGAVARKYRELKELAGVVEALDKVGELLQSSQGQ